MTLIIAKKIDENISFISDSKITDINEVRNNILTSNLKVFILNKKTCLAFAGNVYFAEKFLKHFYSLKIYNLHYLLQYCCLLNRESNNSIEFALGYINEMEKPELYKIKNGTVENNLQNLWLGDHLAFEKYQFFFHNIQENLNTKMKMNFAFKDVIENEDIETVGNFMISASSWKPQGFNENIFTYDCQHASTIMYLPSVKLKPFETKLMQVVSDENGGFSETYLTSLTIDLPAIAIYFHVGKFGVLFCSSINHNKPIVIYDKNDGKTFVNHVKQKYGITLEGFVLKDDKYIIKVTGE